MYALSITYLFVLFLVVAYESSVEGLIMSNSQERHNADYLNEILLSSPSNQMQLYESSFSIDRFDYSHVKLESSAMVVEDILSIKTPYNMAFDAAGNLFVASEQGLLKRTLDLTVSIVSPNNTLFGITIFNGTIVYVTNTYTNGIDYYDSAKQKYSNYLSSFGSFQGTPYAISVDSKGNLYVTMVNSDDDKAQIIKVEAITKLVTSIYDSPKFYSEGIVVDVSSDILYFTNVKDHTILTIDLNALTAPPKHFAGNRKEVTKGIGGYLDGSALMSSFNGPRGLAINYIDNTIYVADTGNGLIRAIKESNDNYFVSTVAGVPNKMGYNGNNRTTSEAQLNYPIGVTTDSFGYLYIADTNSNLVRGVFHSNQIPTKSPTYEPSADPTASPFESIQSEMPSASPVVNKTLSPSGLPTVDPTALSSFVPTVLPTAQPMLTLPTYQSNYSHPTTVPTTFPTIDPTAFPSSVPTVLPTVDPTSGPSVLPTPIPSGIPTAIPTASFPIPKTKSTSQGWIESMLTTFIAAVLILTAAFCLYYRSNVLSDGRYSQIEMAEIDDAFGEEENDV